MKAEVLAEIKTAVEELIAAHSCSAEAKAAGEKWLAAVGTEGEAKETAALMAEMEADVMGVDGLISFAESEVGKKVLGDFAATLAAHGHELKDAGAKYCDCPACVAALKILSHKAEL